MKRKGETGSPCLIPLEREKVAVGEEFNRIEKKAEEVKLIIHFIDNPRQSKRLSTIQTYISNYV